MKKHLFNTETVFLSNNYELFNFLDMNRIINNSHVNTLVESMKIDGFKGVLQVIYTDIFDGVAKYYILDGQHRIAAAKRLGIEIRFQITELKKKKDVASFIARYNNSSKSWGTAQFLDVWSSIGTEEYVKLNKIFRETGIQITPLVECYTYSTSMKEFRSGKMTFPNETESDKMIEQLMDLNAYLPKKAFCRRSIIRLMRQEKYNHEAVKQGVLAYSNAVGSFPENEIELRDVFQKIIDKHC